MTTFVAIYLFFLIFVIATMVVTQYLRGTHDLLTMRNAILFGFCIWMLVGGALTNLIGPRTAFILENPDGTSFMFALMSTVLLIVFLWSYRRGFVVKRLAAMVPTTQVVPSTSALWIIAFILLAVGAIMRFGILPLPSQIATNLSITFPAVACGIAAWIWSPRFFNPLVLGLVAVIVVVSVLTVSTGAFGRRPIVTVAAALMWGLYYSHLRYQNPAVAIPKFALIAIVPIIFIALYTSVRAAGEKDRTGLDHVRAIQTHGDVWSGLYGLAAGQGAAGNSMWLIEQYSDRGKGRFETRPLFTVYYFMLLPIPRNMWDGKPDPMSTRLPHMAAVTKVDRANIKLSVGIVGHAAAEGGWFALIIYGILGGLFIRFFDEILRLNLWSPFVVLAMGSSLGQVFGIPRGETAVMAMLLVVGTVGTYVCMLVLGKMLERVYGSAAVQEPYGPELDPQDGDYGQLGEYGDYVEGGTSDSGWSGAPPGALPTR